MPPIRHLAAELKLLADRRGRGRREVPPTRSAQGASAREARENQAIVILVLAAVEDGSAAAVALSRASAPEDRGISEACRMAR